MSARFLTRRSLSPLIGGLPTPARSGMAVRRGLQHLVGARVSQNWSPKKVEPSGFRDRRHRVEQILDVANAAAPEVTLVRARRRQGRPPRCGVRHPSWQAEGCAAARVPGKQRHTR
jgi:hypothetical protein